MDDSYANGGFKKMPKGQPPVDQELVDAHEEVANPRAVAKALRKPKEELPPKDKPSTDKIDLKKWM